MKHLKYLKYLKEYISLSLADEKFLEENPEYIYKSEDNEDEDNQEYFINGNIHNSLYSGIKNSGRQNLSNQGKTNISGSNGK